MLRIDIREWFFGQLRRQQAGFESRPSVELLCRAEKKEKRQKCKNEILHGIGMDYRNWFTLYEKNISNIWTEIQ